MGAKDHSHGESSANAVSQAVEPFSSRCYFRVVVQRKDSQSMGRYEIQRLEPFFLLILMSRKLWLV